MVCSCSIYANESSTDRATDSSTIKGDLIGGGDQLRVHEVHKDFRESFDFTSRLKRLQLLYSNFAVFTST